MKDRVANVTRWILYALLFIGALAGVLFYTHGLGSWGVPGIETGGTGSSNFLYLGAIFFYLAIIVLIVTPVYTMVNNPQNLKKMLISAGVFIVVFAISYAIAGNAFTPLQLERYPSHPTAEISRLVGMGLYAVYITFGLAVIAILYSVVIKIFQ